MINVLADFQAAFFGTLVELGRGTRMTMDPRRLFALRRQEIEDERKQLAEQLAMLDKESAELAMAEAVVERLIRTVGTRAAAQPHPAAGSVGDGPSG